MRAGCEQRSEERYEYSAFSARHFALFVNTTCRSCKLLLCLPQLDLELTDLVASIELRVGRCHDEAQRH